MNAGPYLEVLFLPWATFPHAFAVGPVRFWDYGRCAAKEITNPAAAAHLAKYFESYVEHDGKPVGSVTICSHGTTDVRAMSPAERRDVRKAVDALVLSVIAPQVKVAVCARNNTMGPPSANMFELVGQRFTPGDEWLAVRAGGAQHVWRVGQVQFRVRRPWETGGTFGAPDMELLAALGGLLVGNQPLAERVFRSLEWYRMANVEDDQVSVLSRGVMIATAFEILLEFPAQGKRRYFVDYVEREIAEPGCRRSARTHENGRVYDLSLAGCWAWDFYRESWATACAGTRPNSEISPRRRIPWLIGSANSRGPTSAIGTSIGRWIGAIDSAYAGERRKYTLRSVLANPPIGNRDVGVAMTGGRLSLRDPSARFPSPVQHVHLHTGGVPVSSQASDSRNSAASSRNVTQNDSDTYRVARPRPTGRSSPSRVRPASARRATSWETRQRAARSARTSGQRVGGHEARPSPHRQQ